MKNWLKYLLIVGFLVAVIVGSFAYGYKLGVLDTSKQWKYACVNGAIVGHGKGGILYWCGQALSL